MKGTLHKTDKGWVVNYRDNGIRDGMSLNYHKAAQYPLHPDETNMDVLNPSPEGKEVEFETIDYSQSCKECGETVERGRSCSKGCFMKPGNFVATGKLEYARILEPKESWDDIWRAFYIAEKQVPIGAPRLIIDVWLVENYQPPKKK